MPLDAGCGFEPMPEELLERRPVVCQCRQAVPNVTRRQDAEFAPQASRTPPIVCDRDYCGQRVSALTDSILAVSSSESGEAFEYGGKPGASADGDNARR